MTLESLCQEFPVLCINEDGVKIFLDDLKKCEEKHSQQEGIDLLISLTEKYIDQPEISNFKLLIEAVAALSR